MRRPARVLIMGTVLALLAGSGVALWASRGTGLEPAPEASADTLGDHGPVPEFSLVERSGRRVTLEDLRGTVWVTSFIYTERTPGPGAAVAEVPRRSGWQVVVIAGAGTSP